MTVTVAVPLHRSRRWVDNVEANVRRLPAEVTEVLISDATVEDDAAEVLSARLADDDRVTVLARAEELTWFEHYQDLVERATGDLCSWLPHDDDFDASWVPALRAGLAENPTAWLAFGRVLGVRADGATATTWQPPPIRSGLLEGVEVLDLALAQQAWQPFRGLFRRREVLAAGIGMEPYGDYPGVDMTWTLAVGLRSGWVSVPTTSTRKRYHDANTHTTFRQAPGDHQRAALEMVRRFGPGGVEGARMRLTARRATLRVVSRHQTSRVRGRLHRLLPR
ncbi:glycosyltransferase [Rhabdothermincola salaria]|uniref:glycosyltransferase n=1 Tax=Rhabdothermincola salaria TaxID=2903142 RepID=UPI001E3ABA63|nr:glycosyltransferase [Rhabdothermincola salaria]